jgi:hypothetical protein
MSCRLWKQKRNKMAIYKANGKHVNCYYDEMFYERLDDFKHNDSIVIVEVTSENFEKFIDPESQTEAYKLFENFTFREIGYTDYGDWDGLSSIVGKEETKNLKKVYFDCEDYKETTFAVLLYNKFTFVTLIRD